MLATFELMKKDLDKTLEKSFGVSLSDGARLLCNILESLLVVVMFLTAAFCRDLRF
jgi:hypothetical protein